MWHVPREELGTRLPLRFQGKRHVDRLVRELESFQKLSEKGG